MTTKTNTVAVYDDGRFIAKIGAVKDENGKPTAFGLIDDIKRAMVFASWADAFATIEIICEKLGLCSKDFHAIDIDEIIK